MNGYHTVIPKTYTHKWVLVIGIGYTIEYMPIPTDRILKKVSVYLPFFKLIIRTLYIKQLEQDEPREPNTGAIT